MKAMTLHAYGDLRLGNVLDPWGDGSVGDDSPIAGDRALSSVALSRILSWTMHHVTALEHAADIRGFFPR